MYNYNIYIYDTSPINGYRLPHETRQQLGQAHGQLHQHRVELEVGPVVSQGTAAAAQATLLKKALRSRDLWKILGKQ